MQSKKIIVLWMVGGVVLGIAGLGVTYYLMTNEFDLFRATTQGQDFTDLACGTPLDHPAWETGHPCHGAMNRQFAAAALFGFASLAIAVGSIIIGFRRLTEHAGPDTTE